MTMAVFAVCRAFGPEDPRPMCRQLEIRLRERDAGKVMGGTHAVVH